MAGIKQPIQDILELLSTLEVVNQDTQTVALYARIWHDQYKNEKEGKTYVYPKPAAFLELINNPSYQELGGGFQSADVGWRIHIIHEFYDTQDGTMEQDLTIYDLRDQIVALLSLFEPTGCGPMVRVGEGHDHDHTNINEYIVEFVCHFIDSKGSPYDPDSLKYRNGQFSDITVNKNILSAPPDAPGEAPENEITTIQSQPMFIIPK